MSLVTVAKNKLDRLKKTHKMIGDSLTKMEEGVNTEDESKVSAGMVLFGFAGIAFQDYGGQLFEEAAKAAKEKHTIEN